MFIFMYLYTNGIFILETHTSSSSSSSSLSMVKKGEIKLLGTAASPYVNRVQFVLNLKSIEYEFIEENLACKSELLLTSNPVYKKIPVLFHANKHPICESLVIIEYLDEFQPDVHRILPSVPMDRADNKFWASYVDNTYFPMFEELRRTPGKEDKDVIKKQIIEGSMLLEKAFEKFSNGRAYFGGDDIGYMDVVLGCFIAWIQFGIKHNEFNAFDEVKTPKLAKWAERIRSHESLKGAIPGNEPLVNFHMMLQIHKPPRAA